MVLLKNNFDAFVAQDTGAVFEQGLGKEETLINQDLGL